MKIIVRHGNTIPTVNDIYDKQLAYCSEDQSLYIKDNNVVKRISNDVIDEHSYYYVDTGLFSDKHAWVSKEIYLDANKKIVLTIRFDSEEDNQLSFRVANNSSNDFDLFNIIIAIHDQMFPPNRDISKKDTVTIEAGNYTDFIIETANPDGTSVSHKSNHSISYQGLVKFDATNVRIDIRLCNFNDDKTYFFKEALAINYGLVTKLCKPGIGVVGE